MAKFLTALSDELQHFIAEQKIYFVATAATDGRVNLSPKGMDTFRVLTPNCVGYLDATGSGSETSAHLIANGRITVMFCALNGPPLILRLYGRGRAVRPAVSEWAQLRPVFGAPLPGERQLILVDIQSVQTSCGFGVPLYNFAGERTMLREWAERKGDGGLRDYRATKNARSIDGLPTGLLNS